MVVAALVMVGAGVVLLALLVLAVLGPARRLSRASTALRTSVRQRTVALQVLVNSRRRGAE